jgi:hypothetical protein
VWPTERCWPNRYRIYPGFSDIAQEENETNSTYNALQAGLRIEARHGATAQFAYTYSHEIDDVSGDLNSLSDPFNAAYNRGSGAFDRRHIFNASYIYAFPFYLHNGNTLERTVLGGWEVSGITQAESGVPIPMFYTGADTLGLGGGTTDRPDQVAKVSYPKTRLAWFSTSSFADPRAPWPGGTNQGFGDSGKDAVRGPGLLNFNLSLFKTIPFTGRENGPNLELRFESFNTFNHTEFGGIGANNGLDTDGVDTNSHDSNFGLVTSAYDGRVLQLGGRIHF